MTIAKILAEVAINTSETEIPDYSWNAAKDGLIDSLGCAIAGWRQPGIAESLSLERIISAKGNGSVLFYGDRLALPAAAFCNSAIIHAMDFDNNYPGADLHILSMVIPAAFACAEEKGKTGKEVLSAIILGVEVASRIAKPYCSAKKQHNYFLTTSLVGGWGAVATAARLLNLSVTETVNAYGIYYAQTCGNRQTLLEKALTKRLQPGFATKAAVYSTMLAQAGVTGPELIFAGKAGFYRLYTQSQPPEESYFHTRGSISAITECKMKKIPTCGIHHPNIISAIKLKQKHQFRVEDIEKCEFFISDGADTLVSTPYTPGKNLQADAQFSAPYAIALALNYGEVSVGHFYTDAIAQDQTTADLAGKVIEVKHFADLKLKGYETCQDGYKYTKVYLKDGTILEDAHFNQNIYCQSSTEIETKFLECLKTGNNFDVSLINKIRQIDTTENITAFIQENLIINREQPPCP